MLCHVRNSEGDRSQNVLVRLWVGDVERVPECRSWPEAGGRPVNEGHRKHRDPRRRRLWHQGYWNDKLERS